jgi:hypothetical protein
MRLLGAAILASLTVTACSLPPFPPEGTGGTGGTPSTGGTSSAGGTLSAGGGFLTGGARFTAGMTSTGGTFSTGGTTGPGGGMSTCPTTRPSSPASCAAYTANSAGCTYGDVACTCDGSSWECIAQCPQTEPTGACSYEGQECIYAQSTCSCTGGQWSCAACPDPRPNSGDACGTMMYRCQYASSITCSCGGTPDSSDVWRCGMCPGAQPTAGAGCGSDSFACAFGQTVCLCLPDQWQCYAPNCSGGADRTATPFTCIFGEQACTFLGQYAWLGPGSTISCSPQCPPDQPLSGSTCSPWPSAACTYGDALCKCQDGNWWCQTTCPASQPVNNTPCTLTGSCTYGSAICGCSGGTWLCG